MTPYARLALLALVACAHAQNYVDRGARYIDSEPTVASTPVPILKQINKHNEDGSYTYGYEAADGSFKIETKSPTGEVKGKYGYKDDGGKLRVVEYGANKYGFQPAGDGITVAPPTLVDETTRDQPPKQQGGRSQYRAQDYDYEEPAPAPRPAPRQQQYRPNPQPQQQYRPAPQPQPQQQYRPAPQPQPQQQQYRPAASGPTPPKPAFFAGAAPSPPSDNLFNAQPAQPRHTQYQASKQDFRPSPSFQQFSNPDFDAPAPPRQSSNFGQQSNTQPYSMLDELLKEYALPSNGAAPLHDITFGSY
ncbi:unnamed protein product [Arctia plantaginis]|uniref:Cuticular protein n=1 Tax=Arctia plantaginis TaxID=874455 RepID=A0A8S0ZME0_ARCPL|nr:unnamed protein product [Arctia plantaginis]CAB3238801.1 unnamed protein product [Arctia plantaginis]